jgi:EAL domain-containing protein (putative c-di-GMP-specific phosphodiesterase class I)/CRP-like cAMP-binding protein
MPFGTSQIFEPGMLLMEEGNLGDIAYYIESGLVEVSIRKGHDDLVLAYLSDGDLIGEMALLNQDVRSATVKAVQSTRAIPINAQYVRQKLTDADPIISLIMRVVLERFCEVRGKVLAVPAEFLDSAAPPTASPVQRRWSEDGHRVHKRLELMSALAKAVCDGDFKLLYQPVLDLKTRSVVGFEALIRWPHPTLGLIAPTEFIPLSEETRDIIPIGRWVFETACRSLQIIRQELGIDGDAEPWMSINMSSVQLEDKHFIHHISDVLYRTQIPPSAIKIELTESILVENTELALQFFQKIRELGIKIAIDDFGTGYSSLSYLHKFHFDALKIDQAFVQRMLNDPRSMAILKSVVLMAQKLDVELIAEGIEQEIEYSALSQMGCQYGQGYLFSRPTELNDIVRH